MVNLSFPVIAISVIKKGIAARYEAVDISRRNPANSEKVLSKGDKSPWYGTNESRNKILKTTNMMSQKR